MKSKYRDLDKIRDDVRSAGQSFIGFYMEDLILRITELENNDSKKQLIEEYYNNQVVTKDSKISGTATRVNSVIRIICAEQVVYALELIDGTDSRVSKVSVAKAKNTLLKIKTGELILPKLH